MPDENSKKLVEALRRRAKGERSDFPYDDASALMAMAADQIEALDKLCDTLALEA